MKTTMLITLTTLLLGLNLNLASAQKFANYAPDAAYAPTYTATPEIAAISVYNNPQSKKLVMDYATKKGSTMTLTVYDAHGQQFATKTINTLKGNQRVSLDISDLYRGGYFLSLQGADYSETPMFVVVK